MKNKIKTKGFIAVQLHTGIILLVVLMVCFAFAMNTFAKVNDYHVVKQRCIAAAQAQLDSIELTGQPLPDNQSTRLWPKIKYSINKTDPTDQWQGSRLIEITASSKSYNNTVKVQLCRYITKKQN